MSGGRRYRKRPVEITAIQWLGDNVQAVLEFIEPLNQLPNPNGYVTPGVGHVPALGQLEIPTLEGVMTASIGDYIIRGVAHEVYPCKPEIFEQTYDLVE